MRAGRLRRNAVRGVAALVLGWAAVLGGTVLLAPSASAAPTATVYIQDLTPPLVSVDQNGQVTFINQIADKAVQVGGGLVPSLLTATVHTDVALALPSGTHTLQAQPASDPNPEPNSSWKEQFRQSCVTCTITYTYRVSLPPSVVGSAVNTLTAQAVAALPQNQVVTYNGQQTTVTIGVPTPFIVNTLLPLPNLPSVGLPSRIQLTVPTPGGVSVPGAPGLPQAGTVTTTTTTTTTTTLLQGIGGAQYEYLSGLGAPRMAPTGSAGAAFDQRLLTSSSSSSSTASDGSGGTPGRSTSASVPVYALDTAGATSPAPRPGSPLSVPALVAVVVLAGSAVALVRVQQARRAATRS
ncbi:MAG: exported protein of unknown function [Frankiales bacterium]|nr:exported protein of unknown function [Frankiales bacterium]